MQASRNQSLPSVVDLSAELFSQGSDHAKKGCYYIRQGEVYVILYNGFVGHMAHLKPGDYFGEHNLQKIGLSLKFGIPNCIPPDIGSYFLDTNRGIYCQNIRYSEKGEEEEQQRANWNWVADQCQC